MYSKQGGARSQLVTSRKRAREGNKAKGGRGITLAAQGISRHKNTGEKAEKRKKQVPASGTRSSGS